MRPKEWDRLFDCSSEKLPDNAYPPWDKVRAEYQRVHAQVLAHLTQHGRVSLTQTSVLERQWLPTVAHSVAHQVTHGHYHLGQLTYLHRLLVPASSGARLSPALEPKA